MSKETIITNLIEKWRGRASIKYIYENSLFLLCFHLLPWLLSIYFLFFLAQNTPHQEQRVELFIPNLQQILWINLHRPIPRQMKNPFNQAPIFTKKSSPCSFANPASTSLMVAPILGYVPLAKFLSSQISILTYNTLI